MDEIMPEAGGRALGFCRLKAEPAIDSVTTGSLVLEFVEAVGGRTVGEVFEGQRHFDLVVAIRNFLDEGQAMVEAVKNAARQRLRPVLATAVTDAAGFLPMAISTGVGAEVQRPLATVVIGGVLTSTLLTLIVLPILYVMIEQRRGAQAHR